MKLMMSIEFIKKELIEYDGPTLNLMEVCGSHTAAVSKYGIRSLLSDKIQLISGPGCPVCVTPSAYIDKLIDIALTSACTVVTFGDMMRVPGSFESLSMARSRGAKVKMVYSPMDILFLAEKKPEMNFVYAAVGFETTAPVYALLLDEIIQKGITNVRLLTALKTMPTVIEALLSDNRQEDSRIHGFIAPGHVCAVTGSDIFKPIADKFQIPFSVSGFSGDDLLRSIYGLVCMCRENRFGVENYYKSAVDGAGNKIALEKVNKYFEVYDCTWRGIGCIKGSGLALRDEYAIYDAGSRELNEDVRFNQACKCGEILTGKAKPSDCPLFSTICTPNTPKGACMVSLEGCCYHHYRNR